MSAEQVSNKSSRSRLRTALGWSSAPFVVTLLLVPVVSADARPDSAQEAPVRQLLVRYEKAVEDRDLDAFRRLKPNLSDSDARRLQRSFASIQKHEVEIEVVSIRIAGQRAEVRIRRRDLINGGSVSELASSFPQTLSLVEAKAGWTIEDIGR